MKPPCPAVVFADVDQTFVGQTTSAAVGRAGEIFAREAIVLVLCSSMTRAELEMSQQELAIRHPFICESGAAILIPHGYFPFDVPCDRGLPGYHVIEFGTPYADVVALLRRTSRRIGVPVIGFSDLSVEQVADEFGLSLSQARLAKLREYDEPFRLASGSSEAHRRVWRALRAARLVCTHRALYEHVGASVNKGTSVDVLTTLYRRAFGPVVTVGVGTASNGLSLLRRVKWPFLFESGAADNAPTLTRIPRLHVAPQPAAWIDSIVDVARQSRDRARRHVSAAG
jgi:mannosyl-3-phosphoglycerate phosphatase